MTPLLDTLIVKFKRWDDAHLEDVAARYGGTVGLKMAPIRWASVKIEHTRASDLFLAFMADPDVEDVEFDSTVKGDAVVTFFAPLPAGNGTAENLHGLKRMNSFAAFKHATGLGVKVAVVDSGMNLNHRVTPSFINKPQEHWNSAWNGDIVEVSEGAWEDVTICGGNLIPMWQHGMGCIATAVADGLNETGPAGCGSAPKASLVNMATFIDNHQSTGTVINGALLSWNLYGAKVISISFGSGGSNMPLAASKQAGGIWWDALTYLKGNALVFCSAGNDSAEAGYQFPAGYAAYDGHFGVGCTTYEDFDKPALYSNGGLSANIVAPGHSNFTQFNYNWNQYTNPLMAAHVPDGWVHPIPGVMWEIDAGTIIAGLKAFDGTSCACPMAAGVAALVLSANPALTVLEAREVILATMDKGQHPDFYARFLPTTGVVNALKAVLEAKARATPGSIYPHLRFFGHGVEQHVVAGVPSTHLRGALAVEITGLSTDPITSVELWADSEKLYDGPPRTTWGDNLLPLAAAKLAGKAVRIVVRTASNVADETYSDIFAYAVSNVPPVTVSDPASGAPVFGEGIVLRALSDNPPVRISYRWGSEPWQDYAGPIAPRTDVLQFYGVDALGNVEGGVDYARQ